MKPFKGRMMLDIDVERDFTLDTPRFWDNIWSDKYGLGQIVEDPDKSSPSLQEYQIKLYRRELPNGEFFDLAKGSRDCRMEWKGIDFSSDSIINNFRHGNYPVIKLKKNTMPDYKGWVEEYLHKSYTIGGEIIWPVKNSINVARAFNNPHVIDRMDLTLYCIQKHYQGVKSLPKSGLNSLLQCIRENSWFFDLFVDFKGYVDFFFLNGLVDNNYDTILWMDDVGRPKNVREYDMFYDKMMGFLADRNRLIDEFAKKN